MSASYINRQAVANSIELLTEIRGGYEAIVRQFPKSDSLPYYLDHIRGINDTIAILESTQVTARRTA